ncbi:MAG TPA: hypothetical protein VK014_12355 [Cyclobacteriaceae bacterium]|nr:hypothetical protein [Cyclobacteriaceae bacterium]
MRIDLKKDILPHFLGIASFYLLVLLYFSPIVFDGKMMFQGDILQWEGSAKEILDYRESTGEEALWTNRMFGGMPSYLISLESAGDITNLLIKIATLGLPHPINALFMGMIGMYVFLISFKIRAEIAIMGAWAFAFNTFNLISLEAGHNAKIWAICLIPLLFAGIHIAFNGKKLLGVALTAFALMLQLKFNHAQITYYTLIAVVIYGIGQLVYARNQKQLPEMLKTVAILILGALLAVGANAGRLLPVIEYGKYSTRGETNLTADEASSTGLDKEYAFRWSQGKLESLTLLIPNFYGGASRDALPKNSATEQALRQNGIAPAEINSFISGAPTYWGDQPGTGGPIYGGAIMVFLFVLGIIYAPGKYRNIFLAITIVSLMLSWGKNLQWFNYTLFDYLPGYNKFRAVSMALGVTLFAIPVLGCLGLEQVIQNTQKKEAIKALLTAFGIVGGLSLVLFLFAGMFGFRNAADANFPDWLTNALQEDRKTLLKNDAFRSFIFITLSAGLIFAAIKQKISNLVALAAVAILVVIDVWMVDKRYLDKESFIENPSASFFAPTPADQKIMKDQEYFRVLNIFESTFNEARTSYRFNSIGGYHGAKMGRYQDLIEQALSPEINGFIQKAQEGNFDYDNIHVLNMLNTRYIMAGRDENAVFENPSANGPAWFPQEIFYVSSNTEEMTILKELQTKTQATINRNEFGEVAIGAGTVDLIAYQPNRLNYTVNASRGGLIVFSEVYYPAGWKAFINGEEKEILRVNYLLRGIEVPEGTLEVELRFEPSTYYNSSTIMVVVQYLILLLLIGALVFTYKKQ